MPSGWKEEMKMEKKKKSDNLRIERLGKAKNLEGKKKKD